ncbi:hypothetical protein T492DRAFT_859022 [Pavlovales sp. CCMP2436]|nr:hypothetical protein T492DRAFT_859022 [Pavlovales sp. CCMP2436]
MFCWSERCVAHCLLRALVGCAGLGATARADGSTGLVARELGGGPKAGKVGRIQLSALKLGGGEALGLIALELCGGLALEMGDDDDEALTRRLQQEEWAGSEGTRGAGLEGAGKAQAGTGGTSGGRVQAVDSTAEFESHLKAAGLHKPVFVAEPHM